MLRGENIICGTSTTGTGTLTMAATPAAVGAIDPHVFLLAQGYSNGGVHLIPYCIIEYADSTFAKPTQMEQGIGTYTLGASLTADTLARTTIQSSQVVSGPTYTDAGSAINIGTAANVLVFTGARSFDLVFCNPYFDKTSSFADTVGFMPDHASINTNPITVRNSGDELFCQFRISKSIFLRRGSVYVQSATTVSSSAFFRIYEVSTDGQPGRLVIDLGALGGANPLNGTGFISTALATGITLPAGEYFFSFFYTYGGAAPALQGLNAGYVQANTSQLGSSGTLNIGTAFATGGSNPAPDPANKTGYGNRGSTPIGIWLKDS